MSADNRTPHTDALETLGTIHKHEEKRDAIHLGVEPIEAGATLKPGTHVCIINGKAYSARSGKPVGIVDPFLEQPVYPGQRFWLVVYPRQITSLRHVWEHPDFPASLDLPQVEQTEPLDEKAKSMKWIEAYAASLSGEYLDEFMLVTADELIETAKTWVDPNSRWGGDYLVKGGLFEGNYVSRDFWRHFEVVTGTAPANGETPSFFSCSC